MPKMNVRAWTALGVLGAVVLVLIGWLFMISPQLSDASSLNDQRAAAELQNTKLSIQIDGLRKVDKTKMRTDLATALSALPPDSGLADFFRQLKAEADKSLVKLPAIGPGGPSQVRATPNAASAGSSGTAGNGAATSASGRIFSIPVTLQVTGTVPNLLDFLNRVQTDEGRRALVTGVVVSGGGTTARGASAGVTTMSMTMQLYSAPQSPATIEQFQKLLLGK